MDLTSSQADTPHPAGPPEQAVATQLVAKERAVGATEGETTHNRNMRLVSDTVNLSKAVAVLLLGLILPFALCLQAYQAAGKLTGSFDAATDLKALSEALPPPVKNFRSANDYATLALVYLESSNQRAMLGKQRMKVVIIHIGFAVISVGLLLVVLGIDGGGIDAVGGGKDRGVSVSIRAASSGVAVFLLGALLAGGGGLLPNTYRTPDIPGFGGIDSYSRSILNLSPGRLAELEAVLKICDRDAASLIDKQMCFESATASAFSK